ncbi:MAG TPA: HAD family hydrolase [Longimicrobiales bacterium]|nr:HAD family hydrolase [Longimicrobiales bacterium]
MNSARQDSPRGSAAPPLPEPAPAGIVFDLDGTLYAQRPVRLAMALRLAANCLRRPVAGPAVVRALQAYRSAQQSLRSRPGQHPDLAGEQIRLAAESIGVPGEHVTAAVEQWFEQAPLSVLRHALRPGMRDLLAQARAAGRRLAVVSDYPAGAKLASLGLSGLFDPVVAAQDPGVGCFKPDPRGLKCVLEQWTLRPEQCVYVGDRPAVDAEAARRAGMRCIILGRGPAAGGRQYHRAGNVAELRHLLSLE